MQKCKIHPVTHKGSFRWIWRHVGIDGAIRESVKSYELFYDCVLAARASGYEPQLKP